MDKQKFVGIRGAYISFVQLPKDLHTCQLSWTHLRNLRNEGILFLLFVYKVAFLSACWYCTNFIFEAQGINFYELLAVFIKQENAPHASLFHFMKLDLASLIFKILMFGLYFVRTLLSPYQLWLIFIVQDLQSTFFTIMVFQGVGGILSWQIVLIFFKPKIHRIACVSFTFLVISRNNICLFS